MSKPLFRAIPVEYAGLYADESLVDVQQLGVSLQGLAKLSNAIVHFYLNGEIAKDSRLYQVRIFAGPPKRGSIVYDIVALMATGSLPLYMPLLLDLAEDYVPRLFSAVIRLATGRRDQMEKVTDALIDMAKTHAEFAKQVHAGHIHCGMFFTANGNRPKTTAIPMPTLNCQSIHQPPSNQHNTD